MHLQNRRPATVSGTKVQREGCQSLEIPPGNCLHSLLILQATYILSVPLLTGLHTNKTFLQIHIEITPLIT